MNNEVRVRFAPSPTGPLHIGGVRTALYNFLFAKKHKGKFILRIEDTDQARYVAGAETYIKEALKWCGMTFDEGPDEGGLFTPYRQSERKKMYGEYAQKLIDEGNAYYAFDTPEELDAMRERLRAAGVPNPQYNIVTRASMRNSLNLPKEETEALIKAGEPYVIRLKIPRKEEIRLNDMIRGWVLVHSSAIDDKVLMKSDGMPTYHLANVVDDHLMKITHVIRGEEWLPSAPLHVLLYKYLGWQEEMPQFAHLPLLLKPDGNGKLSKRDADKNGFPLFPTDWQDPETKEIASGFRESGYLPEALINFLAFLGWNPGTQQELFTMQELIESFSIDRIGKSGVKFDIEKAKWYNQQYLRKKSDKELAELLISFLEKEGIKCDPDKAAHVSSLMKERATFPYELWTEGKYFFCAPATFDEKTVTAKWNETAVEIINTFIDRAANLPTFDAASIKALLHEIMEEKEVKIGKILPAVRLAVTGVGFGPDLMQIMEIIGREETIGRMKATLNQLGQ